MGNKHEGFLVHTVLLNDLGVRNVIAASIECGITHHSTDYRRMLG